MTPISRDKLRFIENTHAAIKLIFLASVFLVFFFVYIISTALACRYGSMLRRRYSSRLVPDLVRSSRWLAIINSIITAIEMRC